MRYRMIKECNCGISGPVTLVFGWRSHRGKLIPQSNCRACRFKIPRPDPIKWMYQKLYPNDKANNKRSENFMLQRIAKKKDEPKPKAKKKKVYSHISGAYVNVNSV